LCPRKLPSFAATWRVRDVPEAVISRLLGAAWISLKTETP
jgi:hypothetical protein